MRIVLDTIVLVSGLLNPHGPPGRIVDLITSGLVQVLYDDRIIGEYREVLARPRLNFDPDDVETLLDFIASEGELVTSTPLPLTLPDPDDLPFPEVAVATTADTLVTGNADHYRPPAGQHQVAVCTPAAFIGLWKSSAAT